MQYIAMHWPALFNIAGAGAEITGVFLMAKRYTNMPWHQWPLALVTALWGGKPAKDLGYGADITQENHKKSLLGLTLIGIGFALQAIPSIISLL